MKIGDKINSIYDIMRDEAGAEVKPPAIVQPEGEYMTMLHTTPEVDQFFTDSTPNPPDVTLGHCGTQRDVIMQDNVIHEVCVETSCISGDVTATSTSVYHPVEISSPAQNISPVTSQTQSDVRVPDDDVIHLTMPNLDDMRNDAHTQACSAASRITTTDPVSTAGKSHGNTNPRDRKQPPRDMESASAKARGVEKNPEISKQLLKSLTEKILKRMNQRSDQDNAAKNELETAVSTLTSVSAGTETCVQMANVTPEMGSVIPEAIDVSSTTTAVDDNRDVILNNLSADLPGMETRALERGSVMTSHSVMTSYEQQLVRNARSASLSTNTNVSNQCVQTPDDVLTKSSVITHSLSCSRANTNISVPPPPHLQHNSASVASIQNSSISKTPQYIKTQSTQSAHQNGYTAVPIISPTPDITMNAGSVASINAASTINAGSTCAAPVNARTKCAAPVNAGIAVAAPMNDGSTCAAPLNASITVGAAPIPQGPPPPMYYNPYVTNPAAPYTLPTSTLPVRATSPNTTERALMMERYNQFYMEQTSNYQYTVGAHNKETYSLKSPDSGYGESCVSPRELFRNQVQYPEICEAMSGEVEGRGKIAKRRKSAPPMYVKQFWQPLPLDKYDKYTIAKLEVDPAGYKYYLETPISTTQKVDQDRITYLNKGQYYGLTLDYNGERPLKVQTVKTVIMVVFREDKHLDDEHKAWTFWHSRQHSYKQRVIDIDTKNSVGVSPSCTEEISFNAVAVKWNPRDSPVKVNIAVHCLSTDFSNQKGVKGLPLHVQIDTFETSTKDCLPISRAYCQIKVFCDKGAERKTRDEERRKHCRVKQEVPSITKSSRKRAEDVFHEAAERSLFYPMADLHTQPILFSPCFDSVDTSRESPVDLTTQDEDGSSSITSSGDHYDSSEDTAPPAPKRARLDSVVQLSSYSNILIYVREKHEVVFTAVMLRSPTLHGLLQAVEEKYNIPVDKIMNSYKRSKKGILVRMDDNIVRHYSHEATFIIELNQERQGFELILSEIDNS